MPESSHVGRFCAVAVVVCMLLSSAAGATQYTYDALGRLQTVTDSSGDTAEYVYDAAGNLLQVQRHNSSQLSIISFTPESGPVGTSVQLTGSGFSAVPGENALSFNGAAATVTGASTTSLATSVPPGASTGPIAVTVNGVTAQSASDFVVTADDGSPRITDFSPKCAAPDATITVSGVNFKPAPSATRVEVGNKVASAIVSSPTSLTFKVPRLTVGGKVYVATAVGSSESDVPLTVAIAGLSCAAWYETRWVSADDPQIPIVLPANKYSVFYFRGTPNDWITLQAYDVAPSANFVSAYFISEDATSSSSLLLGPNRTYTFHAPLIQHSGTYAFRLNASSATTLNAQVESAYTLTPDSSGADIHLLPRHTRRMAFEANDASQFGIGVNPVAFSPTGANASFLQLYSPTGRAVGYWPGSQNACSETIVYYGCHSIIPPLSEVGTYAFVMNPNSAVTSDFRFWMSNDIDLTLQPGTSQFVGITRFGQNARLKFYGEAGSGMSIDIEDLQTSLGNAVSLYAFDPQNRQLSYSSEITSRSFTTGGGMVTIPLLSQTGFYTLLVSPDGGGAANFTATLDPGVPLEIDGPPLNLATDAPGKGIRLTIDASENQKFGVALLGLDFAGGSTAGINAIVYAPDGTRLTNFYCPQPISPRPGCDADLGPFPVAGRYAITLEPSALAPGFNLTAQATTDLSVGIGTMPTSAAVNRDGGNARLTFLGVPGQGQTITISNYASTPSGLRTWVTVQRPDGVVINSPLYSRLDISGGTGTIKIGDFPMEGTYTAFMDPLEAQRIGWTAAITPGVDVIEGQVPVHKDVVPGPWARMRFNASVGEHYAVGLKVNSLNNPTGSTLKLTVFDPNGRALLDRDTLQTSVTCGTSAGGCDFDIPVITQAGEYQVWAELPVSNPNDASVELGATADLVIQGSSGTFDLSSRGQNGVLIFSGVEGATPQISFARTSATGSDRGVAFKVYAPDGSLVGGSTLSGNAVTLSYTTPVLPASGDYQLYLDPINGYPTVLTVSINSP